MMRKSRLTLTAAAVLLALCGCDKSEAPGAGAEEAPADHADHADHAAHADHADHAKPAAETDKAAPPSMALPKVPAGAKVQFGVLKDGQVIKGAVVDGKVQVAVKMVAEGIAVKPAGMPEEGSGHHHVMIDEAALPAGTAVPADETHIHFGKGQTEATIPVAPGERTLTLQFADGLHRSYGPALSSSVKVKVEAE